MVKIGRHPKVNNLYIFINKKVENRRKVSVFFKGETYSYMLPAHRAETFVGIFQRRQGGSSIY